MRMPPLARPVLLSTLVDRKPKGKSVLTVDQFVLESAVEVVLDVGNNVGGFDVEFDEGLNGEELTVDQPGLESAVGVVLDVGNNVGGFDVDFAGGLNGEELIVAQFVLESSVVGVGDNVGG
ncbi:hypothetical protein Bbelb_129710 [Branchiostoma belcheri]|nr:hypothetical protein Bbelb_129710 [Branchiostoma belcheri]